jgi:hypothetical protein
MSMTHIPTNLCFVFHNPRESKSLVFTVTGEEDFSCPVVLLLLTGSQFPSPTREDDKFWDRFFDASLGPYGRPHQSLLELHDFQTAYSMDPGGVECGSA